MHFSIKLIECELQAVATMGQYERLVCEDWAIMIFLSSFEEKHRQLILDDPVLEKLLTALSGACSEPVMRNGRSSATRSHLSVSFRGMGL